MELKIIGGDYAVSEGRLCSVSGADEIFPLMPDFGSRLYLLPGVKKTERAALCEAFIAEALTGEQEVAVSSVSLSEVGDEIRIALSLRYKGGDLDVALSL
jgi:hypothetical protein